MKKTHLLLTFLFLQICISLFGQIKVDESSIQETNQKLISQEKTISDLTHELEKANLKIEHLDEKYAELIKSSEERLQTKINEVDSKYYYYVIFGSVIITIVGFAINYAGRQLIKKRVEALIKRTAVNYAKEKTDQVIREKINDETIVETIRKKGEPVIDEMILELQSKGSKVISGIKEKGDVAISSMVARQITKDIESKVGKSDAQIKKINERSRANEFFDHAMESNNSLVQIELYKKVLELQPDNVYALNNIGVSYANIEKHETAITHLNKALEIDPNYGLAHANLAHSYNQLGQLDKAFEFVQKAIEKQTNLDWVHSIKGNILIKQGKKEESLESHNLAIAYKPNSAEAYFNRAYYYEEIKEFDKSEHDYLKAQELGFKNKALLYNNFAVLFRRKKDFDTALTYIEKAREENPDFGNIDGTVALIYADKGDKENFYKYLEIALSKGCKAWNYLSDSGFDKYRSEPRLTKLLSEYKKT